MNSLKKLGLALIQLFKQPSLINLIIENRHVWRKYCEKNHPNYTNGLPVVDLHLLIGREIELNRYSFLNGGSLLTDIALLKGLALKIPNCSYFEIGTWRGESVANVAEVANKCITMNLSNEEMMKAHGNINIINQIGIFIKNFTNIRLLEANSLTFNFATLNEKFDLIFIDGDHHFKSVLSDTINVFKHLIHEQSIVVWHDYSYQPDDVRHEVLSAILEALPNHLHSNLYHVRNTNCCIYHPKKLSQSKSLEQHDYPFYNFASKISIQNN